MAAQAKNTMELLEAIHMSLSNIQEQLNKKNKHGQKDGFYDGPSDNTGGSSKGMGDLLSGKGSISKSAFGNASMSGASLAEIGKGLLALSKVGKPKKVGEYLDKVAEFIEKMTKFAKGFDSSKGKKSVESMKDFSKGLTELLKVITVKKLIALKLAGLVMTEKTGKQIGKFYNSLIKELKKGVDKADKKFMKSLADLTNGIWKLLLVLVGAIVILTILVALNLKATLIALGIVTLMLLIVIGAFWLISKFMTSKDGKQAHKGLKDFAHLVKALAILMGTIIIVGLIAYFMPIEALLLAFGILFITIGAIWALSKIIEKSNGKDGKKGKLARTLWAFVGLLLTVTIVLLILKWMVRNEKEMKKTIVGVLVLIVVMGALMLFTLALDKLTKKVSVKNLLKGMGIILLIGITMILAAVLMLVVAVLLDKLASYGWGEIFKNLLMLSLTIIMAGAIILIIGMIAKSLWKYLLIGAIVMALIGGMIILICWMVTKWISYFEEIEQYGWGKLFLNLLFIGLLTIEFAALAAIIGFLCAIPIVAICLAIGVVVITAIGGLLILISWIYTKVIEYFKPLEDYGWGSLMLGILFIGLVTLETVLIAAIIGLIGGLISPFIITGSIIMAALGGLLILLCWIYTKVIEYFKPLEDYGWGSLMLGILFIGLVTLELGAIAALIGFLSGLFAPFLIIGSIVMPALGGLLILLCWIYTQVIEYFKPLEDYGWGKLMKGIGWMGLVTGEVGAIVTALGWLTKKVWDLILLGAAAMASLSALILGLCLLYTQIIKYFKPLEDYGWGKLALGILKMAGVTALLGVLLVVIGWLSKLGGFSLILGAIVMAALAGFLLLLCWLYTKVVEYFKPLEDYGWGKLALGILYMGLITLEIGAIAFLIGLLSIVGVVFILAGIIGVLLLTAFAATIEGLLLKIFDICRLMEEEGGMLNIVVDIFKMMVILIAYGFLIGVVAGVISGIGGAVSIIGKWGVDKMMKMQDSIYELIQKIIDCAHLIEENGGWDIGKDIVKIGAFMGEYTALISVAGGIGGAIGGICSWIGKKGVNQMIQMQQKINDLVKEIINCANLVRDFETKNDTTIYGWIVKVGEIMDAYQSNVAGKGGKSGLVGAICDFFGGSNDYEEVVENMRYIYSFIDRICDLGTLLKKWYDENNGWNSYGLVEWIGKVGELLNAYGNLSYEEPEDLDDIDDAIDVVDDLADWTKCVCRMMTYFTDWMKSAGITSGGDAINMIKSYFKFVNSYIDEMNSLASYVEHGWDYSKVTNMLKELKSTSDSIVKISDNLTHVLKSFEPASTGFLESIMGSGDNDPSERLKVVMDNLTDAIIIWGTKDFTAASENITKLTPIICGNIDSILEKFRESQTETSTLNDKLKELGTTFDDVLVKHKDERVQALEAVRESFDKVSESIDKVKDSMQQLQDQDFETLSGNIQMVAESFMKAFEEWNATNATANPEEFNEYASQAESEGTTWKDKSAATRNADSEARTQGRGGNTTIVNQGQGGYQGSRNITVWFGAKAMHGRFEVG